ncbi:MAG: hypothetical protein MRJ67_10640 [Nitrospirales bacterium]|nr:hypothetical protein [Nitrospirales bacterium]
MRTPLQRSIIWLPTCGTMLLIGRACLATGLLVMLAGLGQSVCAAGGGQPKFQRISTQYIAALGDPDATSGNGAESWGLWPLDPGPRGVRLSRLEELEEAGGIAPARWTFDRTDWWLEEHGLIMEQPTFPIPPGKYLVTGDREVTTVLTIHPADKDGNSRWELDDQATLYDVTHLRCRSARYTPTTGEAGKIRRIGRDVVQQAHIVRQTTCGLQPIRDVNHSQPKAGPSMSVKSWM